MHVFDENARLLSMSPCVSGTTWPRSSFTASSWLKPFVAKDKQAHTLCFFGPLPAFHGVRSRAFVSTWNSPGLTPRSDTPSQSPVYVQVDPSTEISGAVVTR